MAKLIYATGLTGGGVNNLDGSVSGADLTDGDFAIALSNNEFIPYLLDADSGLSESSPDRIAPDTSPGTKMWIRQAPYGAPGQISGFAMATPPTGWLECDGSAISRTTYSTLFTAIGTLYGVGNGSTTFNIPDYRGEFLRGWAHGSTNDPDKATRTDAGGGGTGDNIGTKQAAAFASHTHGGVHRNGSDWAATGGEGITVGSTNAAGDNETRPRNVNVLFCIKY